MDFFKLQTPLSFVANTNPIIYVVKSLQQNQFHKLKVSQALSLLEFYKKGLRISALCQEYISRGKLVLVLPRSATRKEEKEARNGNEVGVLEVGGWDEYHHSCGP